MKILMTGGTGLIGQEIGKKLSQMGHQIVVVTRSQMRAQKVLTFAAEIIECDLNKDELAAEKFQGVDAVIHLAGESVDGRWNAEKKDQILNSRVKSTANLLRQCPPTVKSLICASAQGIYGDRADEEITEQSLAGKGFLAEVCQAWENEVHKHFKNRKVILRIGLVLSKKGGALAKFVELFRKNLGAVLGNGRQWMSYISLHDLSELFIAAVTDARYSGVINAVNNDTVRNSEFTKILAENLRVILLPNVPELVLKTALGEMSDLALSSLKVKSVSLNNLNFNFRDIDLKKFLRTELADFSDGCSLFYAEQFIPAPRKNVFEFFSDAHNLEKLTPSLLSFHIEKVSTPLMAEGTLIDYRLKIHGIPVKWRTRIDQWTPPEKFIDFQLSGPYKYWNHVHLFIEVPGGTLMIDEVRYKVPFGHLGRLVAGDFVASDVKKIFDYRREVIAGTQFS